MLKWINEGGIYKIRLAPLQNLIEVWKGYNARSWSNNVCRDKSYPTCKEAQKEAISETLRIFQEIVEKLKDVSLSGVKQNCST